jgi:hypothetical protein
MSNHPAGFWIRRLSLIVLLTAAVAVLLWATMGRARMKGDTPEQRIARLCQLADEAPSGAAAVIAEAAAKEPDPAVRAAAVTVLRKVMEPKHRPAVEAALADKDPRVRAAAAGTLGAYQDAASADRLAALAAADEDAKVREGCLAGLERNADPKALVNLMGILEFNDRPGVRARAMESLARYLRLGTWKTDPKNLRVWNNDVETLKHLPEVVLAFRKTGSPLRLHPEHLIPDEDDARKPDPTTMP